MIKKYSLVFIASLCSFFYGFGQVVNSDLESWTNSTTLTPWTKIENVTQESTPANVDGGTYSARQVGRPSDLGQTINGIIPGEDYELSFWYKVIVNDGTDARIWSYWRNGETNIDNNDYDTEDAIRGPKNSYLSNNSGNWVQYSITITAPATSDNFYLEVRTYSGAIVYWDDFEFNQVATCIQPTDPAGTISVTLNCGDSDLNFSTSSSNLY
jgi:hypothetical protein